MVTIKQAAALTGVSEHTLRAWEDRYQVVTPLRTASGYRTYSEQDLDQVRTMTTLVNSGLPARTAAAETRRRHQLGADEDPFAELIAAAASLDAKRLEAELGHRFATHDFDTLVRWWLLPALTRLGEAWSEGLVTVAGEHLVAAQLMRRLSSAYDAAAPGAAGATVLIGAPPGVDHQLGVFAFAVACRRRGLDTTYLGAQMPLSAWQDAAERSHPAAAVTTVPRRRDAPKVARLGAELGTLGIPLWVGGRYQHLGADPSRQLGHDIPQAAQILAEALAATPNASSPRTPDGK